MPTPFFRLPRFDRKTLFICVAGYGVLFGWMWLEMPVTWERIVLYGSPFLLVGLGSRALFGGRHPIFASLLTGVLWGIGTLAWYALSPDPIVIPPATPVYSEPRDVGSALLAVLVLGTILGFLVGFFAGLLIDIWFWLCGASLRWPRREFSDVASWNAMSVITADAVAHEAEEIHPLDRTSTPANPLRLSPVPKLAATELAPSRPHRFRMATLMICVLGYMILFGLLRLWNVQLVTFCFAAGLATAVGLAQATLFRSQQRLRASIIGGVIYCFLAVGLIVYVGNRSDPFFRFDSLFYRSIKAALYYGPFAALAAALVIDIYFLTAGKVLRRLGWEVPRRAYPILNFGPTDVFTYFSFSEIAAREIERERRREQAERDAALSRSV